MTPEAVLERAVSGEATTQAQRDAVRRWLLCDSSQGELFGVSRETVADVVAERLRRLAGVWRAVTARPLEVAGLTETVEVRPDELFRYHLALAELLGRQAATATDRFLVAVAGVPGSGKSVFTTLMARVLAALAPPFGVAVLGLDGYHYPNAYLSAHRTPACVREPGPLKLHKGAPFTFDVGRLVRDLGRLRDGSQTVRLPAYDRTVHEPAEARITVGPEDRLVLVEGNYLLCREGGWRTVPDLFNLKLFLELPAGANRGPLVARHMRGGRSREEAERHYERVDLPNTRWVQATGDEADIVVALDREHGIAGMRRGKGYQEGHGGGQAPV